jgi:tripartite-type tricarboxylate transporter receptor subunit TctC
MQSASSPHVMAGEGRPSTAFSKSLKTWMPATSAGTKVGHGRWPQPLGDVCGASTRWMSRGLAQTCNALKEYASVFAVAVFSVVACAGPSFAQQYPERNVTIIVPYPAGGPTDELARVIAPTLSERLKQSFIVQNMSGGGTITATEHVVRAPPDGYTLLLHNLQISANVSLYGNLPFDTEKDLSPIAFINHNPLVLVGRNTLPPNSLKELLAYMKTHEMKFAHPGVGATGHLATCLLAQEAKVPVNYIPYRGAAPALVDLLGGHVDLFFATPQSVVQQVATGQLKVYGITAKEKSPLFPTADSFVQELGPKLEILYWHALFAPAGTPDAIINKLNGALQEIVADPAILKMWADTGVSPYPNDQRSPAAARALLKSEIARWGEVVRNNNIQVPMQ